MSGWKDGMTIAMGLSNIKLPSLAIFSENPSEEANGLFSTAYQLPRALQTHWANNEKSESRYVSPKSYHAFQGAVKEHDPAQEPCEERLSSTRAADTPLPEKEVQTCQNGSMKDHKRVLKRMSCREMLV
jgi:hypothetical protein